MKTRKAVKEDIDLLINIRMDYLFAEKDVSSEKEVQDIRTKLKEYFTKHLNTGFIAIISENENEVISTAFMSIVERPPLRHFKINNSAQNSLSITSQRCDLYFTKS